MGRSVFLMRMASALNAFSQNLGVEGMVADQAGLIRWLG